MAPNVISGLSHHPTNSQTWNSKSPKKQLRRIELNTEWKQRKRWQVTAVKGFRFQREGKKTHYGYEREKGRTKEWMMKRESGGAWKAHKKRESLKSRHPTLCSHLSDVAFICCVRRSDRCLCVYDNGLCGLLAS